MQAMNPLLRLAPIAIVTTTVATLDAASQLAQGAVRARLAACAQVDPITAHYVWQGQLAHGAEWRVLLKTLPAAVAPLWAWLQASHPYELPQLLLRTEQADPAYAAWVGEQVVLEK